VADLITQILDLAKLQQTGDLTTQRLDLVKLFKLWVQDAELELESKQLSVNWNLTSPEVFCYIDAVLMQRAFDNVLRNAIRFSPEGGALMISIENKNGQIEFSITDQGPGVEESELDKIFAPFTQADNSRDHASGGYGIGLAMVKSILNMHHGEVVANNVKGGGLSVKWSLPDRYRR
jgi:two-component system sensor histidine kinase CpxA